MRAAKSFQPKLARLSLCRFHLSGQHCVRALVCLSLSLAFVFNIFTDLVVPANTGEREGEEKKIKKLLL